MKAWPARLTQDEITLRPFRSSDAAAWREVRDRNAEWLTRWDGTAPPGTSGRPTSYRSLMRRLNAAAGRGWAMPFVLELEGRFAGQVTVNNIIRGSAQMASVGYWIDQAYAGRGVVPRAVAMTVDHCFEAAGLHRIEIAIRPENSNSLRVAEKLGLAEVGYAPRYLHIGGQWCDHRIFAITREECPDGLRARLRQSAHPE